MKPFEPLGYEELSERLKAALPAEASMGLKMAAANGNLPLITLDLVACLYYLANDPDASIRRTARKSLRQLPPTIIHTALTGRLSPKILNWFAHIKLDEPKLYELIALNKNAHDETFIYLAGTSEHQPVIEIIAKNEFRLLNSPEIIEALESNEVALISTVQRAIEFYRLQTGRSYAEFLTEKRAGEETPEESAAPEEETDEDIDEEEELGEEDEVEPEVEADADIVPEDLNLDDLSAEEDIALAPDGDVISTEEESLLEQGVLEKFSIAELMMEDFDKDRFFAEEFLVDAEADLEADTRESLANRIRKMKIVNQMRLGLKGNLEARNILIKSGNKLIQECVLRNPRITIDEVLKLSKDKSAREELIRTIADHREWTKSYTVVHTLCWNPKTPMQRASRFLNRLNVKDLISISRSKQVPGLLAVQARKLVSQKERYR
jgi:hypothetical protein